MVGLFAVPQIIHTLAEWRGGREIHLRPESVRAELPSLRQLRENFGLMMRSAAIGTGIGAIPGAGGPIASFLAYDQARRFSRNKENFGKGELSGVVAPETANNAVTGGTMIPLLSLGIPGDPATAIILGGLLIHGLAPGPLLFTEHRVEVYAIYLSILVAYVMLLLFQYFGIRAFVHVLRVPQHILAVVVAILCVIGSFAIRNSFVDVYVMIGIGLLGYLLLRARIPVTPIILGLVLGPTLEREFRTALILSEGSLNIFYTSMPAMLFFGLTASSSYSTLSGAHGQGRPCRKRRLRSMLDKPHEKTTSVIHARAKTIAEAGGLAAALAGGKLAKLVDVTLSEALVLGLLRRASASTWRSSATARPTWPKSCASTARRASPAPSTAATKWPWRTPPRR
jgi:TctA family transporter